MVKFPNPNPNPEVYGRLLAAVDSLNAREGGEVLPYSKLDPDYLRGNIRDLGLKQRVGDPEDPAHVRKLQMRGLMSAIDRCGMVVDGDGPVVRFAEPYDYRTTGAKTTAMSVVSVEFDTHRHGFPYGSSRSSKEVGERIGLVILGHPVDHKRTPELDSVSDVILSSLATIAVKTSRGKRKIFTPSPYSNAGFVLAGTEPRPWDAKDACPTVAEVEKRLEFEVVAMERFLAAPTETV